VPSKNICFAAKFYWNSINSSLILAASTPVVSSCQSSAPPPSSVNAVNDGLLPTNISEDAQQSSGTYKISTTSLDQTCACVFCFSWEFGNVCHWKGFWGKSSNCFRWEKTPNCGNVDNQLFNKLNISGIFLLLLSPNASENASVWIKCLKIWNFFWKGRAAVIKSRVVCFSTCSFTFRSLKCYTMSAKNPTVSLYHSLKKLTMP